MIRCVASTPFRLWSKLNQAFISRDGPNFVDENTGISVQSFDNHFTVEHWDPESAEPVLEKLSEKMGYSVGGTKQTQLHNKYVDPYQLTALKKALKVYRGKDRFTLGMTFNNSPARSGGCLSALQVVRYQKRERCFIYAKIVEIPKKFAADLLFFNGLLSDLKYSGEVAIVPTCIFFWKVTAPLLVPLFGLGPFKGGMFYDHVVKKIRKREYLASPEYKYRNEARTWIYLKPIIDRMIEKGDIDVEDVED